MEMPKIEDLMPDPNNTVPVPKGYRLLVHVRKADERTKGGIIKIEEMRARETTSTMIAQVIDMGDTAYMDDKRFPTGAWCKIGDYIMFRAHSGTRFKVGEEEFRLINDDSVEAVVADPTQIDRV